MNNIYPYIINRRISPKNKQFLLTHIGHGLYVTLVYDEKGLVGNVTPKELQESGMTISQLKDSAISNLDKAVKLVNK